MYTSITILKDENFDKLFSVKDCNFIESIHIYGYRHYSKEIIQQIIKFNKIKQLDISISKGDLDLNEIANLQSLTSLPLALDSSWNFTASDFYISKNKENAILNESSKLKIDNLITALDPNILNITIFINNRLKKICNVLPPGCINIRIIIESMANYYEILKKYDKVNLLNLPVTIKKIDIIFNIKGGHNENDIGYSNLIKENFREKTKLPFDCELNVIFL